jgi:hypothetical protein
VSDVSDERRIQKLHVIGTEAQRRGIDLAVTLWQARHGDSAPITPHLRGEVLAAICACWRQAEIDNLRDAE